MPNLFLNNTTTTTVKGKGPVGIVTDNLVLKHNYNAGSVIPVSDGAAYFDGSNDYIALTSAITLSSDSTPCSITFWAWRNVIDQWHTVLGNSGAGNYQFALFDNTGGNRLIFEGETDGDNLEGVTAILAKEWNHFAITTDGSAGGKMYQNGVEISVTVNDTFDWDITLDRIGAGTGNFFGGYICNVGIWNGTQLTQPQIKSIMNKNYAGLTSSETTNLVSWWDLDSIYQNPGDRSNSGYWDGKSILVYENGASDGAGGNTSFHEAVVSKDGDLSSDLFGGEGSFSSGDTGYFSDNSATYDSGAITFRNTGYNALSKGSLLTAGKIYRLDFDVLSYDSDITKMQFNWGSMSPGAYPQIWAVEEGTGSFSVTFKTPIDTFIIYATGDGGAYKSVTIDNLVIREVQNAGELS